MISGPVQKPVFQIKVAEEEKKSFKRSLIIFVIRNQILLFGDKQKITLFEHDTFIIKGRKPFFSLKDISNAMKICIKFNAFNVIQDLTAVN